MSWRSGSGAARARDTAKAYASARAAALETQLGQASNAAQALGSAVEHSNGGAMLTFAAMASELRHVYPFVATLELQPDGIVSAIDPRAGNEGVIGFNVLKDAAYGPGAREALKNRSLTLSGPLGLYHGGIGVIARVPIFLRAPDGRERFWGFAAASVSLPEAVVRAKIDDLVPLGYRYALFIQQPRQKPVVLAGRGTVSMRNSVQQPVRAGNLQFQFAVERRRGWTDTASLITEAVLVLIIALVAAVISIQARQRRDVELQLADAERRLTTENAGLERAQDQARRAHEESSVAEAELNQARSALQQALREMSAERSRLESALFEAKGAADAAEKKAREADRVISELRAALETAQQSAHQTAQLQAERLETIQRASREVADVNAAKFAAALREAREKQEGSAARIATLEQSNRELAQLARSAERAEARASDFARKLEEANAELRKRQHLISEPKTATEDAEPQPEFLPPDTTEPQTEQEPTASSELGEAVEPEPDQQRPLVEEHKHDLRDDHAGPAPQEPPITSASSTQGPEQPSETRPFKPPGDDKKQTRTPRRKSRRPDNQIDLFSSGVHAGPAEEIDTEQVEAEQSDSEAKPSEARPTRRPPVVPPVNVAELRTAINQIVPLLVDGDPGAKDCLRDNRLTFRSAFTAEGYEQFEQSIKAKQYEPALDLLRKAARREGINI